MKSFDDQMMDWARTKPYHQPYDFGDNEDCAGAQFLKESGFATDPVVFSHSWCDDNSIEHDFSTRAWTALAEVPHTYGALAGRLDPMNKVCYTPARSMGDST